MTDLTALRAEIDNDPLVRGYAGMTDLQVSDDINTVYRASEIDASPQDLFGAIKPGDWPPLQEDRDYLSALASMDTVPLTEVEVQNRLTGVANGVFAAGATATAIEALWATTISRARELNLGKVREGTVAQARAL